MIVCTYFVLTFTVLKIHARIYHETWPDVITMAICRTSRSKERLASLQARAFIQAYDVYTIITKVFENYIIFDTSIWLTRNRINGDPIGYLLFLFFNIGKIRHETSKSTASRQQQPRQWSISTTVFRFEG